MDFGLSDEQELLRAEARKFLDENCPLEQVRELGETPSGYSPDLWKQIAELRQGVLSAFHQSGSDFQPGSVRTPAQDPRADD